VVLGGWTDWLGVVLSQWRRREAEGGCYGIGWGRKEDHIMRRSLSLSPSHNVYAGSPTREEWSRSTGTMDGYTPSTNGRMLQHIHAVPTTSIAITDSRWAPWPVLVIVTRQHLHPWPTAPQLTNAW